MRSAPYNPARSCSPPHSVFALGFAMVTQARRSIPPKQVRYPTGCSFASSCSPPRLAATQLLSASQVVTSYGLDFH
jgi:hypothetical protein